MLRRAERHRGHSPFFLVTWSAHFKTSSTGNENGLALLAWLPSAIKRRTERPEKEEDLEDLERFQGGSKACEKVNE